LRGQLWFAVSDSSNSSETSESLGSYYDGLNIWTSLARPFGYGGGVEELTVHRRLADPRCGGRPTTTRVHDVIAESLPALSQPRILDAGCGLGGTMLDFVRRYGGTAVGLTLSDTQRRRALQAARVRGLHARVDIRVQSYDAPPAGPFDLVVAVESLAHSASPEKSVAALAAVLRPGGALAIVDDMPLPAALETEDFHAFRRGWLAPVVWPRARFLEAFRETGLEVLVDRDVTQELRVRTLAQVQRLTLANRWLRPIVPSKRWRSVLDSHHGGLALERLYRRESMQYRLLVARRVANDHAPWRSRTGEPPLETRRLEVADVVAG
jgi:SAM-dependent methyltransferase